VILNSHAMKAIFYDNIGNNISDNNNNYNDKYNDEKDYCFKATGCK